MSLTGVDTLLVALSFTVLFTFYTMMEMEQHNPVCTRTGEHLSLLVYIATLHSIMFNLYSKLDNAFFLPINLPIPRSEGFQDSDSYLRGPKQHSGGV